MAHLTDYVVFRDSALSKRFAMGLSSVAAKHRPTNGTTSTTLD